jgi:hypothetical protein
VLALSIRQPWAWLIIRPDLSLDARLEAAARGEIKDVENRKWPTKVRARVLIHASQSLEIDRGAVLDVLAHVHKRTGRRIILPPDDRLQRGGIIGAVDVVDCVQEHASPYFFGPYGHVLAQPKALAFAPLRGMMGYFNVPGHLVREVG